jgi:uncharacterized protein (DUF433 family)
MALVGDGNCSMAAETKRQNFNITPEEEAELTWLRDTLRAPSTKDAILLAVRILGILAREIKHGHALYLGSESGQLTRLLIPELQPAPDGEWTFLVARPHPWRRQLFVKGRRLRTYTVWMDMQANAMTPEEAADNWDLPLEVIKEILRYCESHRALLEMEAEEERRRLLEEGIRLEPPAARR